MSAGPEATPSSSLRVGSLFSGVGGFDLGLERAGHRVAFQCEADPFRRRVLRHHWPDTPVYDDVRYLGSTARDRPEPKLFCRRGDDADPGRVDLLCGGFPCQDLSVAGLRRGFSGKRSSLFFEFARLADELVGPGGFILIENVPGFLTSCGCARCGERGSVLPEHRGTDFRVAISALADLGFLDLAYRVLDSRHFGVAQRRRRVYILGRRASGRVCAEVLLELGGGGGHPPASWQARAGVATDARGDAPGEGRATRDVAAALTSGSHPGSSAPGRRREDDLNLVAERSAGERIREGDLTRALTAKQGPRGRAGVDLDDAEANWLVPDVSPPLLSGTDGAGQRTTDVECGAFPVRRQPFTVNADGATARERHAFETDTARTIDSNGGYAAGQGGTVVGLEPSAVREAPRGEHAGGPRDVGASGDGQDAERDGPGRDERRGRSGAGGRRGAPAEPDGVRAAAGLPGRLDDHPEDSRVASIHPDAIGRDGVSRTPGPDADGHVRTRDAGLGVIDDGTSYTLSTGAPPAVGPVEAYALRGRDDGVAVEPVDLPNLRAHTGKDGGGHDGFVHQPVADVAQALTVHNTAKGVGQAPDEKDYIVVSPLARGGTIDGEPARRLATTLEELERAEAFLPRHFTRGKDGAPADVVPPITKESDRGDGMAMVHTFNVQPAHMEPDEHGVRNGLEGRVTDHAETVTATQGRRSDRGTLAIFTGRDAYLAAQLERTGYLPPIPYDPGKPLHPDGPRYAAMGDAITVNVAEWIGLRLRAALA